jgi:hypothetical protein
MPHIAEADSLDTTWLSGENLGDAIEATLNDFI